MDVASILTLAQSALSLGLSIEPQVQALFQIVIQKIPLTAEQEKSLNDSQALLTTQLEAPSIPEDQP